MRKNIGTILKLVFLISNRSKTKYKIHPIEVKSGERYSIRSLKRFMEKFKERIGQVYVIDTRNYREKEGIVYLPAYMAMCL